jgi:selenocysteine lyase/cysteine desulfurase
VRPATNELPGRWMTGTQNHEGIAGTAAAIEYLADIGRDPVSDALSRRDALVRAFDRIGTYESELTAALLDGLAEFASVRVWGITDRKRFSERVPTVSITHRRMGTEQLARLLADRGIFVWHGNYYALCLTEDLGLEPEGMVRIGLMHYNTGEEVERLLKVLGDLEN